VAESEENYLRNGGRASLAAHLDIGGKRASLRAHLQQRIIWSQYNLVTDASFNEFALILNRATLADFGPVLRQRTLRLYHDSLARCGVLGLGTPLLPNDAIAPCYRALDDTLPWYKRLV
jgi:chemotaxis protein methyltransferase CheR